jgi:XTP/dITP diphosphohydrolase
MKKLVFVTRNPGKVREIAALLKGKFEVVGLSDIGCNDEIPETAPDLEGNARMKAAFVADRFKVDCFADDTGLEVDELAGRPGVHTARFAGPGADSDANMHHLISALQGSACRTAQFRTCIALIIAGETKTFEGVCKGDIRSERSGREGFGYDPIFAPTIDGKHDLTFAEMTADQKNEVSHRGQAVRKMVAFLSASV